MNDRFNHTSDDAGFAGNDGHGRSGGFLTSVRRAARFGAGLLRAVAGAPAGVERSRRGSFLVLVVATLALMSVFAVVYVTIGKTDAGTKRGVEKGESRDDVPNQFADHVAKIIGDDIFATVNLGVDSQNQPLNVREASDIPGVNWTDRSDSTDPIDSFNPVGTYTSQWNPSLGADPRAGTDPFLASSEPTYLGFNDPGTTRVSFKQRRDWAAISNVAPDGRFVNLYNLRGNFNRPAQDMQNSLTLLDDQGAPTNQLDFGGTLNFNIPAHLTNRQRGLFRPANTIVNGSPQSPNDPNYLDYHFADADGDGFYDSRWCALVDAHDLSNIKNLLRTDDGLRYFFAVRIEDLSGRANVLTAMDLKGPPTNDPQNVVGVVPEVDLRRVLSLIDPLSDDPNDADLKLGYAGLQQPDQAIDPQNKLAENYSKYLPGFNDTDMSMLVGRYTYDALHNPTDGAIHSGLIPPPEVQATTFTAFTYAEPKDRTDLYVKQLGLGRALNTSNVVGANFSIQDMAENLTYRGINDPTVTSQLELVMGGRYRNKQQVRDPDRETVRFSPLRDNRPLSLERDADNIDEIANVKKPDGLADTDAMLWSAYDVRQRITTLSSARPIMPTRVSVPMSQDQLTDADLRREISTDVPSLYSIFADTLIPDSAMEYAWKNDGSQPFNAVRFTNYGAASAELGARIAAHMAVNAKAAMNGSKSSTPLAYTVLLDEKFRDQLDKDWSDKTTQTPKQIGSRTEPWAWWVERRSSSSAETGALDIGIDWTIASNAANRGQSRLGDSDGAYGSDKLESKAINVYATTPQPVLTAAASFYVYTDIPTKATPATYGTAGDQEWDGTGQDGDPYTGKPITIDGTVSDANDDFLMQVVAFQLSNPFDTTIYLTQNGMGDGQPLLVQDRFEYYIEFGGRYFRLANFDVKSPSSAFTAAALNPGETRVFYAMCLPLQSSTGKDIITRWNATKKTFTVDQVKGWLDKQMAVTLSTGDKLPTLVEEFDPTSGKRKTSANFVNLLTVDSSGVSADPTIGTVRLWRAMRSPTDKTSGPINEDPKDLQKDSLPKQFIENDQLVDRLRDPGKTTLDQALKLTGTNNAEIPGTEGGPDNVAAEDPKDNTGFSITRFGLVRRNADPEAGSGFDPRTGGVPAYMLEDKWAGSTLKNKTGTGPTTIDKGTFDNSGSGRGFDEITKLMSNESTTPILPDRELTTEPRQWNKGTIGSNASGKSYNQVRTSFITGLQSSSMRVADLLLPLGIGPEYDPSAPTPGEQHLTLGEALANALDYATPPSANMLYYRLGATPAKKSPLPASEYPKLDRGHLALDRFVPFYDADYDRKFDRAKGADRARGLGIPLALTIFDRVEGIQKSKIPWGVTRPIIGRVNVNTAYRTVLRSVGVLSPTPALASNEWWWTNLDQKSDIATTILAYRDKGMYWPRVSSPNQTVGPVDFRDDVGVKPDQFDKLDGREALTAVDGLRETPGISSVGEVMLAKILDASNPDPTRSNPNNIDFLGYNDAVDYKAGLSAGDQSNMKDTFGERLQIAASATNALTTRSDCFAVWFIVRGYRESDVMGLSNNDPMVPSVNRRFLMIVDRSNVVKFGQKPRILLLKEVPLS